MLGTTYLIYIGISLGIIFWTGRTLNRNGRIFLLENYQDKPQLADAINQMLLVGFYLINIGFISYALKITGEAPREWAKVIEFLSVKIGVNAMLLGFMHFALMFTLQQYSSARKARIATPRTPPAPLMQRPTAPRAR